MANFSDNSDVVLITKSEYLHLKNIEKKFKEIITVIETSDERQNQSIFVNFEEFSRMKSLEDFLSKESALSRGNE